MVFAEKYVGFWLAFLLPTLMLCKPISMFYLLDSNNIKVFARWSCLPSKASIV
jgi:hypothetical protein